MAEITFTAGPFSGQALELPETGISLGRGKDADLVIEDEEISGQHAQLRLEGDEWFVTDLQSSNGTTVNGELIETARLDSGDVVALGDTQFVFGGDGQPAAGAPEEQAPPASQPVPSEEAPVPPGASKQDLALVHEMSKRTEAIRREVGKVIVGQREVLDQILMCLIAGGHALLIGLPGMAKTLMISTISQVLDMSFKRIQFTPDLMPTDITGTDVLETDRETGEKEFRFIKGPLFANILLADEINRTPPKTQASLLEAMQEKRVTAGNTTYSLDKPFFVLATQNPIEQEGTYPLPEAQLDRFMFNIWVDYPLQDEEEKIIGATTVGTRVKPDCILTKEEVLQLQEVVLKIPVSSHVIKYVIRLVRATRPANDDSPELTKKYVSTGAGPRAGQYLVLAAKAMAMLEGRIHVSCKDIRRAAVPVLRHRILTNFAADSEGMRPMDIVNKLLEEITEPGEEDYQ